MSSLNFAGTTTSYLRIPNNNNIFFGTSDFTIEWYQYTTDYATGVALSYARPFSVGYYTEAGGIANSPISIAFEESSDIESGLWLKGSLKNFDLYAGTFFQKWTHFAICRTGQTIYVFVNGARIYTFTGTINFVNNGYDLTIGNEHIPNLTASFKGYMLYFSWVKGVAKYTSNFTVSNTYPAITDNTVLFV
jgi:hypothetical protein